MYKKKESTLSTIINNIIAIAKIAMCLFLMIIMFTWVVQLLEIETKIPFYDNLYYFFSNLCYYFYTPTKDDEEAFDALMYIAFAIVFFLLIFEVASDITTDLINMHERQKELNIENQNEIINKQIQKSYKKHLQNSIKFVALLKLSIVNPLHNTSAFKDENLEQAIKLQSQKIIKEVYSLISTSLKCQIETSPQHMTLMIENSTQLNKTLFFIQSICQVEKYVKAGLQYRIAISTYTETEPLENALNEAIDLLSKASRNKIICYEIVPECLNTVNDNNYKPTGYGNFTTSETQIFELVKKN